MGISRVELYRELGVEFSIIESLLTSAYQNEADREWRNGRGRAPSSFYISNFPGDDPIACGRAAVYSLMDLPEEKPVDIMGMRLMDAGKELELDFTRRLAAEGSLLTGDESKGEDQTKFTDPEVWSSGAVDAIVLPFGWHKGHIVEVKGTSANKINAMRSDPTDTPWSHKKYTHQVKTYIAEAHEQNFAPKVVVCASSWAITKETWASQSMSFHWCPVHQSFECETKEIQLDPPDSGELIYASRDPERGRGLDTVSYFFDYDPDFLAAGKEKLAAWRDAYERGMIPEHPLEDQRKKWTADPCRFCKFAGHKERGGCKKDYAEKITTLAESSWIPLAKRIRPGHSYEKARAEVFARWGIEDPLKEQSKVVA